MAMKMYKVVTINDGMPGFPVPLSLIWPEFRLYGAMGVFTPAQFITNQQVRWWKGILLPALSNDSGDSKSWWEDTLKMAVLPDKFQPETYTINGQDFNHTPSITTLGKRNMIELIDGSIQHLHGIGFGWVTLPDASLRT